MFKREFDFINKGAESMLIAILYISVNNNHSRQQAKKQVPLFAATARDSQGIQEGFM